MGDSLKRVARLCGGLTATDARTGKTVRYNSKGRRIMCDEKLAKKFLDDVDFKAVVIDYTNYKGDRSTRRILPAEIRWGSTEHHPEEQWLLEALDLDKGLERTFAMSQVHEWRAGPR